LHSVSRHRREKGIAATGKPAMQTIPRDIKMTIVQFASASGISANDFIIG
jgi:hypothetical protein